MFTLIFDIKLTKQSTKKFRELIKKGRTTQYANKKSRNWEIQGEKITKRKVLKFRIEGDIGAENPRKRVF